MDYLFLPQRKPVVIQEKDIFSLEVILTSNLRDELLDKGKLDALFLRYSQSTRGNLPSRNLTLLINNSCSYYELSYDGPRLWLTNIQLQKPDLPWKYVSDSLFKDNNKDIGNPLYIYIVDETKPEYPSHLQN